MTGSRSGALAFFDAPGDLAHKNTFRRSSHGEMRPSHTGPTTFQALRKALNGAQRPVHYPAFNRERRVKGHRGRARYHGILVEKLSDARPSGNPPDHRVC